MNSYLLSHWGGVGTNSLEMVLLVDCYMLPLSFEGYVTLQTVSLDWRKKNSMSGLQ